MPRERVGEEPAVSEGARKLFLIVCIILGILIMVLSYLFAPERGPEPGGETTSSAAAAE